MCGSHHPCRPMDVEPDVAAPSDEPLACVDPDPNSDRQTLLGQRSLDVHRRRRSLGGAPEHQERRITLRVDHPALGAFRRRPDQGPVLIQHLAVAFPETLEQARGALDIR